MFKVSSYKTKSHARCPVSCESGAGFTLIEILISIALLVVILSLGLFVSFDFYKSYALHSEKNIIVSVLQKARSQSLNNINQARHGVHFATGQYIIFECTPGTLCTSYTANPATDNVINATYGATVNSSAADIIFDQLSGCLSSVSNNCSASTVTINVTGNTIPISINNEGRIDW